MTSTWASPMAVRIVSPVPSSRRIRIAGSSSSSRCSAWPSLSRSAFDSGSMATWSEGAGNSMPGSSTACDRSATSVSPAAVEVSLATAAMSPGPTFARLSCVLALDRQEVADALLLLPVDVVDVALAPTACR